MKRFRLRLMVCFFVLWSGFETESAWAGDYQYRYVSLDGLPMPAGFEGYTFNLAFINKGDDRVYGNVCNDVFVCFAAVYQDGAVKVLQPRQLSTRPFGVSAADRHTLGGAVSDPADPSVGQAAILQVNKHGVIAGTGANGRGFRLDTRTGVNMELEPLPTEPLAWAMGINDGGEVLGYSFVYGGTERIGVWDAEGRFRTHFVEGTSEVPTVSNRLLFNDSDLIVITAASGGSSYIVPAPGQRFNLADLTENLPATRLPLNYVLGINNHGSLVGFGGAGTQFLLRRIDKDGHCAEGDDDEAP